MEVCGGRRKPGTGHPSGETDVEAMGEIIREVYREEQKKGKVPAKY